MNSPLLIITGGQTGADQAAWRAAKACGLPTGGYMPKGYLTEDGPRPEFATEFGAVAMTTSHYPPLPHPFESLETDRGVPGMSIETSILCDLCGETAYHNGKEILRHIGFEFDNTRRPFSFVVKPSRDVNRHLCLDCANALVRCLRNSGKIEAFNEHPL